MQRDSRVWIWKARRTDVMRSVPSAQGLQWGPSRSTDDDAQNDTAITRPSLAIPATIHDALKQMSAKHPKVRAEASSASGSGVRQTEFFFKSESAKELERAKRTLFSIISPQVSTNTRALSQEPIIDIIHRFPLF